MTGRGARRPRRRGGNWGYAQFNYDPASGAFTPLGEGAGCGFSCHTIVQAKDYVFTTYPKR